MQNNKKAISITFYIKWVIRLAERRMFAKTIIDSDAFLDLPSTARLLYFDLGMRADDDGFVNSPKKIIRMTGATDGDMRMLLESKFVLMCDNGIIVIKHWKINNYIRSDRYTKTKYIKELEVLKLDENGAYTTNDVGIPTGIPDGRQTVGSRETQDRIGKDRLGKDNKTIGEILNERVLEYTSNEELKTALFQFIDHRKSIRKPIKTLYTLNLLLKELDKHTNKLEVINQSIMNGWQGLFEINKRKNNSSSESVNPYRRA